MKRETDQLLKAFIERLTWNGDPLQDDVIIGGNPDPLGDSTAVIALKAPLDRESLREVGEHKPFVMGVGRVGWLYRVEADDAQDRCEDAPDIFKAMVDDSPDLQGTFQGRVKVTKIENNIFETKTKQGLFYISAADFEYEAAFLTPDSGGITEP